ncbi:HU family DNA-binding protein [bacterium]|nr:HU family DNA-binding protein [bacterium]MBU1752983.1 HU family DNA-binding protein [bacterium]
MNKNELGTLVASKTGLSTKDVLFIIDLILAAMKNGLCTEKRIELRGLGSFEVRERAPRKGRILATGEMIDISNYKTVVFVPGKPLKKLVNE